jgi:hypothetical protein
LPVGAWSCRGGGRGCLQGPKVCTQGAQGRHGLRCPGSVSDPVLSCKASWAAWHGASQCRAVGHHLSRERPQGPKHRTELSMSLGSPGLCCFGIASAPGSSLLFHTGHDQRQGSPGGIWELLFFGSPGFEFRTSHLQARCCTACATPPAFFALVIFWIGAFIFLAGLHSDPPSYASHIAGMTAM